MFRLGKFRTYFFKLEKAKMILEKPKIFNKFEDIIFGFSAKNNLDINDNFSFNLSKSIGDEEARVLENRKNFFSKVGLEISD